VFNHELEILEALFDAIADTKLDKETRLVAAKFLRRIGVTSYPSVDRILDALRDKVPEIRRTAAHCLSRCSVKDPEKTKVFTAVEKAIHDPDTSVSKATMEALRPLGPDIASAAVPSLIKMLKGSADVQQEAIKTLAWLGCDATEAIPALIDLIRKHAADDIAIEAGKALLAIDPDGRLLLDYMGKAQGKTARKTLLTALRMIGPAAGSLRRQLQEQWRRNKKGATEELSQPPTSHPDGPEEPDEFWWQGQVYPISPIPCKLLTAVWRKDKVEIAAIVKPVWGTDGDSTSKVKSALNDMNLVLLKAKYPYSYGQKQGFILKK